MASGTLYLVATPIGNLGDFSQRAAEVLRSVSAIACEDTRESGKLLSHFKITTRTVSYHQHSPLRLKREFLERLRAGEDIALITDAGTPGISDPGSELVRYVADLAPEVTISPVPGASAVVAALSIAGFPSDSFLFLGFPPHKNKRQKFFTEALASSYTTVLYESGHRIRKCMEEIALRAGERKIVVCRELTKKFETLYRGTAREIIEQLDERGEFVVVIAAA